MNVLPNEFYAREDVVLIARELLGKILITEFDGLRTSGRIVETEAYNGVADKASHAWAGRRTSRNEVMYAAAGTTYVYICYGIHHLFNVVTNVENVPHAVLIRALEPLEGIDIMLQRMNKQQLDFSVTRGPGNLSKALDIWRHHSGMNLLKAPVWIADDGCRYEASQIIASPRIGVDSAGEDAQLPYRFFVKGNGYVSGRKK